MDQHERAVARRHLAIGLGQFRVRHDEALPRGRLQHADGAESIGALLDYVTPSILWAGVTFWPDSGDGCTLGELDGFVSWAQREQEVEAACLERARQQPAPP